MKEKYNVMVIDDIRENLQLISDVLDPHIYNVSLFTNGFSAIAEIDKENPDIILLDINMPEADGYQICNVLKHKDNSKNIPVIFLSSLSESFDKVKAFESGGVDYITKPFEINELEARILNHVKIKNLQEELRYTNKYLKRLVDEKVKEVTDAQVSTIIAIVKLAEARDCDTGNHIERTRLLCKLISEELFSSGEYSSEIDQDFIDAIYVSSPLHDIGKIAIPDSILLKPAKLTEQEFEIMKMHSMHGYDTLSKVKEQYPSNVFINMGIKIARYHHEKWDGSGYPDGLAKEGIPLEARLMAIADVYDAVRSKRVYKGENTHDESMKFITETSGINFDPVIVDAFNRLNYDTYGEFYH